MKIQTSLEKTARTMLPLAGTSPIMPFDGVLQMLAGAGSTGTLIAETATATRALAFQAGSVCEPALSGFDGLVRTVRVLTDAKSLEWRFYAGECNGVGAGHNMQSVLMEVARLRDEDSRS